MREETVTVDGKRLFYLDEGAGAPVVLIHGNTASSRWFSQVMDLPGLRCYAPDLPNFGRSEPIDSCDIDRYADFILGFLDALEIEPPTLVGHSLGGAVAMSLAVRRSDRIRRLLLVDSAPIGGLTTPEEHYPAIELFRTNRSLLAQALHAVTPHLTDAKLFEELVDDAARMAGPAFAGNARALERFAYSAAASRFRSPVLFVLGAEDILITEAMARETVACFPQARLRVLPNIGHSVVVEDPSLFKTILGEFATA